MEPWELLPFPAEAHVNQRRLSDRTAQVLATAMIAGKLPSQAVAAVSAFEEVQALVAELDEEDG